MGAGLVGIKKGVVQGALKGQVVVFSGFRDANLVTTIENNGGKYSDTLSKATTVLLIKAKGQTSEKTKKAEKVGLKPLTVLEFRNTFKV